MQNIRKWMTFVLLLTVFSYTSIVPTPASASCQADIRDASYVVQAGGIGNCGETIWELQANFLGDIYDEGEAEAEGTCTGNYYNCACAHITEGYKAPSKGMHSDTEPLDDSDYITSWYWTITYYTSPKYTTCVAGQGPCIGTDGNANQSGYYSAESDPTASYSTGNDSVEWSCDQ